ncbi:MAG: sulfatase-like hydrolase/transferase, partial [Lachnospiraceae bacterium]|nr:sulfatase-like hydrolase/transferase [Lachnospiraceae bacterium]
EAIAGDQTATEKVTIQATGDKAATEKVAMQATSKQQAYTTQTNTNFIFTTASLLLAVVLGGLIPSALIVSSPQEFINILDYKSPLWYVVFTMCMAVGSCMIWMRVFFWLARPKTRERLDKIISIVCIIIIINYMFFGTDLGTMTPELKFQDALVIGIKEILINLVAIVLVAALMLVIYSRWKSKLKSVMLVIICAVVGMTVVNSIKINTQARRAYENLESTNTQVPYFTLSTEGKNVVVIMLDRALGYMVPYAVEEVPELKEQFDGFTYYSNVISYSSATNYAAPALYGGYEYTPVELNKRDEEKLVDKHNEALKMMPVMFLQEDYKVTVCDAPYANYQWIPDMSIYNEYPEINAFVSEGKIGEHKVGNQDESQLRKKFFCYSFMKSAPLCLQKLVYGDGSYNLIIDEEESTSQHIDGIYKAVGLNWHFMKSYHVLQGLSDMTIVEEGAKNTFMIMCNNMTHDPMYLQAPEYEPQNVVDNTIYDSEHTDRFTLNGITLNMENENHVSHYHTNMAALMQIGNWLDYLREMGVYDNTRIIIVSDHGRNLNQIDELVYEGASEDVDITTYYPLMLVKDFNAKGFTTSDEFMTNADVPTLATSQLIENPINPFTGKEINNQEKYAHPQYISIAEDWHVDTNNGNQLKPTKWISIEGVGGNIWDMDCWNHIDEECCIPAGAK